MRGKRKQKERKGKVLTHIFPAFNTAILLIFTFVYFPILSSKLYVRSVYLHKNVHIFRDIVHLKKTELDSF